jgi:hypothetical protein
MITQTASPILQSLANLAPTSLLSDLPETFHPIIRFLDNGLAPRETESSKNMRGGHARPPNPKRTNNRA